MCVCVRIYVMLCLGLFVLVSGESKFTLYNIYVCVPAYLPVCVSVRVCVFVYACLLACVFEHPYVCVCVAMQV